MSNKAVIGLGNSLRRDDGIGIVILESLLKAYKYPQIDYLDFGSSSFDLLNRLNDYQVVLLIDGIQAGLKPGQLKIFTLEQAFFEEKQSAVSAHELNLKDIFSLTEKLKIKTKIYVAGVQTKDTGFGDSLSRPLKAKLDSLVREIDGFIKERLL